MIRDTDIVITGIGTVSPYGYGTEVFWNGLANGEDKITEVKKIKLDNNYAKRGGEIDWYISKDYFSKNELRRWDLNTQYSVLAMEEAKLDAKIDEFPSNTGIFMGTLTAGLPFAEMYYDNMLKDKYIPRYITQCFSASVADNVAKRYHLNGPKITVTTACSASAHAIAVGVSYLRRNKIDVAIVGGVDAFCQVTWAGFSALRALSAERISPFSRERQGTQIGEGAGVLVLETYKRAKERNAKIYAIIAGCGASTDAYHITAPNPTGETQAQAIRGAISDANVKLTDIDVICAHGTGTELNDQMESKMIKEVFGKYYKKPSVTSIKSMIGHTMGAAGIHLTIALIGMMRKKMIFPTINYQSADKECDLSIVTNHSITKDINWGLVNAFGFGGNNAALILSNPVYKENEI